MTLIGAVCFNTFLLVAVFALVVRARAEEWWPLKSSIGASFGPSSRQHLRPEIGYDFLPSPGRAKRHPEHHVDECMYMTSEEGEFYHKARTQPDGTACGIYIFGEPDENIEIKFSFLDVTCENGGLVVVVDGWELNGEVFPSPRDHPKALQSRFSEFCGRRKVKQTFLSSQNVALIQYRMPAKGANFAFSVRFIKNPSPCNVLIQLDDIYTLRNYKKRSNCSISSLFPAAIKVLDINVGVTLSKERRTEFETGALHKCQKRGLDDYVQIGGSLGLDTDNMQIADSVCGLHSMSAKHAEFIGCEITTARLVSSGAYDNSITVKFSRLTENDINAYMSVVCIPDDIIPEKK